MRRRPKRISTHDRLPPAEERWRRVYCRRRACKHPGNVTWVCIEAFLARPDAPSVLHEIKFEGPGEAFARLRDSLGMVALHPDDAVEVLEPKLREVISRMAAQVLFRRAT